MNQWSKGKRHWNQQRIKGACCLFVSQNWHWYKEAKQNDFEVITLGNPIGEGGFCRGVWWGGERWRAAHSASGAKDVFLDSSICSTAVLSPLKDANRQLLGHWRQHFLPGKWANIKEYWCWETGPYSSRFPTPSLPPTYQRGWQKVLVVKYPPSSKV